MELGRRLVGELGLEPSVDTLGRWMAHHIADLIDATESATTENRALAERQCFDAILRLWAHRNELPSGKRPFEALEPVIRAIESLDPNDNTPRYFRSAHPTRSEGKEKSEQDTWLELIAGIDYSAKLLIGYCLAQASSVALDKSADWVKLAEEAGADQGVSEIVIRFVSSSADLGRKVDPNGQVRKELEDRIGRLHGFIRLAETLATDLKARLAALPPAEDGADDEEIVLSVAPPLE